VGEPKQTVRDRARSAPPGTEANANGRGEVAVLDAPDRLAETAGIDRGAGPGPEPVPPASAGDAPPRSRSLSVEAVLYGVLIALAAITRFWDLGSRTLHHDESLHTYYSWLYATGQGYVHDPLMHGPFLFHANALVYLLLGDSDATSRYVPALFGTVLVGLPFFLRGPRHLGRWGALAASALLLVSPALLYQSRYIRHDIYTVVGALVLFVAIVRYLERPERRWLVTAGAALGFLLTNHEIVFGIAAIFVGVLWGALLWGRLRSLIPLHVVLAVAAALLWVVRPGPLGRALPKIPWDRSGEHSPRPTRENQLAFYADLLSHPLTIAFALLAGVALVAALVTLARRAGADDAPRIVSGSLLIGGAVGALWAAAVLVVDEEGWTPLGAWGPLADSAPARYVLAGVLVVAGLVIASVGLATVRNAVGGGAAMLTGLFGGARPGSVEAAVLQTGRHPRWIGAALAVGGAIFAVLFSSLFTNPEGLVTATVATDGTLLYWLGQHDYRRGEQPWFYYLLLLPQYELFATLFGVAAVAATGVAVLRALVGRATAGPTFFFRIFLAVWFLGILAALSWAGEKMPWLIVHITLPGTLLAAALLGEFAERWQARRSSAVAADGRFVPSEASTGRLGRRWDWTEPGLVAAILVAGACWFLLAGRLSYGDFVEGETTGGWDRIVSPSSSERWWLLAVPPVAVLALLGLGWLRRGARVAGRSALAAAAIGLVLLQVHAGWRASYAEGDVPKDMLIYTQTSPDVSRMVRELGRLSAELTGGKGLAISYDGNTSWPLQWYLRDFPHRQLREGPTGDAGSVPVAIVANDNPQLAAWREQEGYTAQEYVLRWWFPEGPIYRNFAIAPELPPSQSAWGSADRPHGPAAIAGSVVDGLATQLDPAGQQRLYRLLMYRDLPHPIGWHQGTYRYTLFVRDDLVPLFNTIRY
jgi:predicted membrane-bound mannosyltransferase